MKSSPAHSGMPPSRCSFSNFPFSINKILIMKYLLSANLWYIPELGALYTHTHTHTHTRTRTRTRTRTHTDTHTIRRIKTSHSVHRLHCLCTIHDSQHQTYADHSGKSKTISDFYQRIEKLLVRPDSQRNSLRPPSLELAVATPNSGGINVGS